MRTAAEVGWVEAVAGCTAARVNEIVCQHRLWVYAVWREIPAGESCVCMC